MAGVPIRVRGAAPTRRSPVRRVAHAAAALACAALLAACAAEASDPYAGTPVVEGDSLLRFPSGARVAPGLHAELRYHGRLADAEGGPWLVTSGVQCEGCDAEPSVVLRSVHAPPGAAWEEPGWHAHPGRIVAYDTDRPMLESRLFWGRCLPGRPPGVVQFATEFDGTGRPARALVLLSEVRDGRLRADSLVQAPPAPSAVDAAVRAGRCREVAPEEQVGGF